jgi:hypothetical protein
VHKNVRAYEPLDHIEDRGKSRKVVGPAKTEVRLKHSSRLEDAPDISFQILECRPELRNFAIVEHSEWKREALPFVALNLRLGD